jgi:hypothetical protein
MAIQVSPGVAVSEVDLTTIVPSALSTTGAIAGSFQWGPVNNIITVTSETDMVNRYTQPTNDANTYQTFFTAASFLAYGNQLQVVRAANSATYNATANSQVTLQVQNKDVYQASYLNQNNANIAGPFIARYPGTLGSSLSVSVCANTSLFSTWQYKSLFSAAPGTSAYANTVNGQNDELHIVVVDTKGLFTGTANTVLETYAFASKAFDSVDSSGNSNYYKNKIFNNSGYVFAMDPPEYATTSATWGLFTANTTFANTLANDNYNLTGGTYVVPTDADVTNAYSLFTNKQASQISLVMAGSGSTVVQQYIIDNISTARTDCVAFISPPQTDVVNQPGSESTNIQTWLNALSRSNSYTFADSGWKYMFDRYNNAYRWVPLNGDMAGLCVYTDSVRDPWWSPAGFNRGNLKNVVKLAWNPSQTYRDQLYPLGVNPVVSFPGQGTVLFGDKTLQSKPSAFDRINVRRLFIVLEQTISKAAQYSLFEFNDAFTQAQFVSLVTPFLRQVQGRRGISDFAVVCDSTNNTPAVVDANQFVGSIFIKPARSINFIQLNFVAVGTGVAFSTVTNAV